MLTVETGEGVNGADSFLTVADVAGLDALYGGLLDWVGPAVAPITEEGREQALRRAFHHLTITYGQDLSGVMADVEQPGIFPRVECLRFGEAYPENTVPPQARRAQAELADYMLDRGAGPAQIMPAESPEDRVQQYRTGRHTVVYTHGGASTTFPHVEHLLRAFAGIKVTGIKEWRC
jgi:hypothetical protein